MLVDTNIKFNQQNAYTTYNKHTNSFKQINNVDNNSKNASNNFIDVLNAN